MDCQSIASLCQVFKRDHLYTRLSVMRRSAYISHVYLYQTCASVGLDTSVRLTHGSTICPKP